MLSPYRILLVDDEELIRRSLGGLLQDNGYEVVTAGSGPECLQIMSAQHFGLVILDMIMPDMSGIDVLQKIKEMYEDTEVIMITGYADKEKAVATFRLGAYNFIEKPFESKEILNIISRCLNQLDLRREIEMKSQELKESEVKYHSLFENSRDAIYITSREGRFIDLNQSMLDLFGYTKEEMAEISAKKLYVDPDERYRFKQEIEQKGSMRDYEVRLRRKDGTEMDCLLSSTLWTDDRGILGYQGIIHDITERKQREREWEAIATMTNALRTAQTRTDMLPVILNQVLDLLKAEGAALAMCDMDSGETLLELACGSCANWTGVRLPPGTGVSGLVIKSGQAYLNNNVQGDPLFARPDLIGDLNAVACVPLIAQEQTIGALFIGRKTDIANNEVRLLTTIGDIAANAIYRSTLYEQTERRLQRITALHAIDMTISSSLDLLVTLNVLLYQVIANIGVDAADVLLFNPHNQTLEYAAGSGFRFRAIQQSRLRLGEGYAGRAALERRIVSVHDTREVECVHDTREVECVHARAQLLQNEKFVSHYIVPLLAKGQLKGVLEIFHRYPFTFDQEGIEFLEALALQAAIAIDNAELFNNLQRSHTELILAYDTTLEGWSHALDMRDKETEGHTQRVTEMTLRLARAMGMSDAELVHVRRGALLHDIGKMGIPDCILHKQEPLTEEEGKIMRCHPDFAYELLLPIAFLRLALDIPYCHHEKWDGTGYPRGLKGEEIPLTARIFAVVDVWDALRSDRPYRPAWSEGKAREYIRQNAGTQFDPDVVEVFLENFPKGSES